jgi:hypothetical protein
MRTISRLTCHREDSLSPKSPHTARPTPRVNGTAVLRTGRAPSPSSRPHHSHCGHLGDCRSHPASAQGRPSPPSTPGRRVGDAPRPPLPRGPRRWSTSRPGASRAGPTQEASSGRASHRDPVSRPLPPHAAGPRHLQWRRGQRPTSTHVRGAH